MLQAAQEASWPGAQLDFHLLEVSVPIFPLRSSPHESAGPDLQGTILDQTSELCTGWPVSLAPLMNGWGVGSFALVCLSLHRLQEEGNGWPLKLL